MKKKATRWGLHDNDGGGGGGGGEMIMVKKGSSKEGILGDGYGIDSDDGEEHGDDDGMGDGGGGGSGGGEMMAVKKG